MKAKLIKTEVNYILEDDKGVVIASTSLNKEGLSLSIKNCQAIEHGYDLDELAREFCHPGNGVRDNFQPVFKGIFIQGFQKCLELMGDKKFSAGQLLNAMDLVWQWIHGEDYGCKTLTEVQDKHIQSLQQTEWDVEIEMEVVPDFYSRSDKDGSIFTSNKKEIPKLDATGCLILKRI